MAGRPQRSVLLAGAALLVALGVSALWLSGPRRPDVLLIVVDTLRARHLGAYGYGRDTSPSLDAFAAQNLLFRQAIASSPWTSPSVASIFTSLYPPAHGIHLSSTGGGLKGRLSLDDARATLAEILRRGGYRTRAVVANPWISARLGFAQGFEQFRSLRSEDPARAYAGAERVTDAAIEALEDAAGGDLPARLLGRREPVFLYLHYMDPHLPNQPPAPLARRFRRAPPGHHLSHFESPEVAREIALYDAEIALLDAQLNRLFAHLLDRDLYEDSVIVIASDHGEQIYEYGRHAHGLTMHKLELHVPLMMRLPGAESAAIDTIVSNIDIAPTILDAVGLEAPPAVQGVSLLSQLALRRERGVFAGTTYRGNAKSYTRGDGMKLIVRFDAPSSAIVGPEAEQRVGVYDSLDDYLEREPLERDALLEDLRQRFYAVYDESVRLGGQRTGGDEEIDPETVEKLKRLGYLR